MAEKDHKQYYRRRNEGALPWEIEGNTRTATKEHPIFSGGSVRPESSTGTLQNHPLPQDFVPEPVYVEFLVEHYGIPEEFTFAQLPEFKLYWLETGEARKAWQNKFKNHVIYLWKRRQSETGQRTHRSTVEKLTDTSWAEGIQLDFDGSEPTA